jgi:hypothetical protein
MMSWIRERWSQWRNKYAAHERRQATARRAMGRELGFHR